MTDCEAAKYFDKFKLVPREMDCKSGRSPLPPNGIQHGGQPAESASTEGKWRPLSITTNS